ncbi:MAG: S8 family serine peptidase [Fibrobacter sp.]|nr:S8 family serine peptidase [Fibrobacter sp.]
MKRFFAIYFFLMFGLVWSSPSVLLTSDRHVTAWNFVNYRFRLTNTSTAPVLNPEINYYAAQAPLGAEVDVSSGLNPVTASVVQAGQYTVVKFSLHGLLFPGDSVEIHCRIYSEGFLMGWDSSNDWSYQHNAEVYEPNYFMAVYDASHNILWGSDPLGGNQNASDVVLWTDRGSNFTVERYNGDTAEVVPAGRFWLIKDMPISPKERDLLAERGIVKHSVGRHQGKTLALFRSEADVQKSLLDSLIAGFYNTVAVDDSTPIEIEFYQDSLYEDSSRIDMEIFCWPDVSVNGCVEEVAACGGDDIGVARGLLIAKVRKDSLQCLAQSRNIDGLVVQHELGLASSAVDRDAVNISSLQNNDTAWQHALQMDRATREWLSGVKYTGDGIVVGVYESGLDYIHPDFAEYDSSMDLVPREMKREELFGLDGRALSRQVNGHDAHAYGVAGIIGGNGNDSSGFKYRGIAPKVHYYAGSNSSPNVQVGHVINHSHITDSILAAYVNEDYVIDAAVFKNWNSGCTKLDTLSAVSVANCVEGDTLTKTVVYAAGNNGDNEGDPSYKYGIHRGYHSVLSNSKNAITVGNMTSKEKVRFHHSSMGPTWDGRIKPDVMAPGATSQIVANTDHPVEILIDYVKIYRKDSANHYLIIDPIENNLTISEQGYTDRTYGDIGGGNYAYNFRSTTTMHLGITVGWKLDKKYDVKPTDEIEVRFRKGDGWDDNDYIYGNVFFGTHEYAFYRPPNNLIDSLSGEYPNEDFSDTVWHVSAPAIWESHANYNTTRFSLSALDSSIDAYYLRLDFSFIRGIVVPTVCDSNRCGYIFPVEGGTSAAAPFVSGIAALMYQKFRDTTGDSLHRHSMRNSTVKALLIHTAIDMEDSEQAHFSGNPDLYAAHHDGTPHYTPYGKGPDFATGWGYVDGKAALDLISDYNKNTKEFARFREIEIGNGFEKRWTTVVDSAQSRLRVTLVWDDAPGERDKAVNPEYFKESKLVNDLDMYLVSPSGEYHYPWRLDPLPTEYIDTSGNHSDVATGFERILEGNVHDAYNGCGSGDRLDEVCFDHLNNVEVVDVDNPEPGRWQVVVMGRRLEDYNNADSSAQVATLVSDFALKESNFCSVVHDYAPQTTYRCSYTLSDNAISYVTFDERTFVGAGDNIQLFDENGTLLGTYAENQLAGKRLKFRSRLLTVVLHSDNDNSQGWGFGVTKIKVYPMSVLKMPFEFTKKVE